jgi:putative DNA primase/helicase
MTDGVDPFAPLQESAASHSNEKPLADVVPIAPVPDAAPPAFFDHRRLGRPAATWTYRDAEGRLLGYAVRFECDGKKQILPHAYCRHPDGSEGWCWKSFAAPRPLYGLDRLAARPDAPVLIVEGEKTADAASSIFKEYVAVTWPGGSKAVGKVDWSPLTGRRMTLWPDADSSGRVAMTEVARCLAALKDTVVSSVKLPDILPEGWDLADPAPESFDVERTLGAASRTGTSPALPFGYSFSKRGLVWRDDGDDDELHISGPFEVMAETRDGEGTSWGVLLGWNDHDGRFHKQALARAMLAGDGADARRILLDGGLYLSPNRKARDRLNSFLGMVRSANRARATARVGWHEGFFVLPDETIGENVSKETILLQQVGRIRHSFRTKGNLSDWKDKVARFAAKNSRLSLAISAAFAAALIEPSGAESGGIHLRGPSSTGKSTALIVAGSAWGGGDPGGYIRSWRATSNGLEGVALSHCDALLCLDELSQVPAHEAGEVAYMLGNGSGKARSNRDGLAKPAAHWRCLFLSSGELSLADKISEDRRGKRTAGQSVRLIDLPADAGAGLGLFEDLHGFRTPDEFARYLKTASSASYGTAAREFIRHVAGDIERICGVISRYSMKFVAEAVDPSADGQVVRVAHRFALIGVAGEIATGAGILPWEAGAALQAAKRCFQDWLQARGGLDATEVREGINQVRSFLAAHGQSRFVPAWESQSGSYAVRDIAGFRKQANDAWDFYVTATAWKDELCRGYDSQSVAKALVTKGWLVSPDGGHHRACQIRVPGHGRQRLYHVTSEILEAE